MVDLEEIEGAYKNKVEKEDKVFLENLNKPENKVKRKELEREYSEKLKLLLEEYNQNVSDFLSQKNVELFTKNEEIKEEEKKKLESRFRVKPLSMDLGYRQRGRIWFKVSKFNFRISFRNFIHKVLPAKLVLFFLSAKLVIINSYIEIKFYVLSFIRRVFVKLRDFFKRIKKFLVDGFIKTRKFFIEKIKKVFSFFGKKGKEGEDGKSGGEKEGEGEKK